MFLHLVILAADCPHAAPFFGIENNWPFAPLAIQFDQCNPPELSRNIIKRERPCLSVFLWENPRSSGILPAHLQRKRAARDTRRRGENGRIPEVHSAKWR